MELYQKSGYLNTDYVLSLNCTFNLITGGRGTGKTFGLLDTALRQGKKYIYLRRTQTNIDLIGTEEYSPLKSIERVRGIETRTKKINKYVAAHYLGENQEPLGYCMALSTFANVRGFDATDVDWLIFDEFVPEKNARKIKDEGEAFLNCYETINRNRELEGEEPVKVFCCGNSNNISNPVFISFGMVNIARRAQKSGREVTVLKDRGIAYINLADSKISNLKKDTALYRASKNKSFNSMSLDNDFGETTDDIKSYNLRGLKCIAAIDDIFAIYRLKDGRYYVSEHISGTPHTFTTAEIDLKRFKLKYPRVMSDYARNLVTFESDFCLSVFASILT